MATPTRRHQHIHAVDTATPFRWIVHEDVRHAVDVALQPGQRGYTLCGETVTVEHRRLGCEPECADCDDAWRKAIGVRTRAQRGVPRAGVTNS